MSNPSTGNLERARHLSVRLLGEPGLNLPDFRQMIALALDEAEQRGAERERGRRATPMLDARTTERFAWKWEDR